MRPVSTMLAKIALLLFAAGGFYLLAVHKHQQRQQARDMPVKLTDACSEKLQKYAQRALEEMGVEVRLNTLAVDMDMRSITVKGPDGSETIRCRSRIWAAGVKASPLAEQLAKATGAETDRAGRIAVNPDCSLPGHPEVFALGDMVLLNKLPGVAQPALQEGKYVGKLIKNRLSGGPDPEPFRYFDKGSMATIGHKKAVAHAFGRNFTGILGYWMWLFVHDLYLIGWGNRLGTLYTWMRSMAHARNRGHRLITFEQGKEPTARGVAPPEEPPDQYHRPDADPPRASETS